MKKRSCIRVFFFMTFVLHCLVARADCFDDAARYHHVNPWVLRAIAQVESNFQERARNKNRNGTWDYGMMQINSIHLPRLNKYGISKADLFDGCKSVYIAAWMLRQKINKHGNTWVAVGAYHSETPRFRDSYARKVEAVIRRWSKNYVTGL
jgi:soluble lytic murein transglycosylase-like protein